MTKNFADAVKREGNLTRTENAAVALKSTRSALLDLFAIAGAIREKSEAEVEALFRNALNEDALYATILMFYARNVRGGLGERKTFRRMLHYLANVHPEIVEKNIELIPHFGRWDDVYVLVGTPAEEKMWEFVGRTFYADIALYLEKKPVSLLAKWLKSVNTSSRKSVELGRLTAKKLRMSEKKYRKILVELRKHIDIVEAKMSAREWEGIDYESVPSYAMKNYRKAFGRHDPVGFTGYIESVTSGEKTIKSSTLFPYDIFLATMDSDFSFSTGRYGKRGAYFNMEFDAVLEEQWKALPNYVKEGSNVLVMADTSGSMEMYRGLPMAISLSLAVYFAERNTGAYKDLFLTFSESPRFVELKGSTLSEKVSNIESIVANTNLEKAFDLILDTALRYGIAPEEMPKALLVISDMQFDQAQRQSGWRSYKPAPTFHESMVKKYNTAGYEMPTVVYWQVCARSSALQAERNTPNVMLVSGASASTFKSVMENLGYTPYEAMLNVLNDPMYAEVRI